MRSLVTEVCLWSDPAGAKEFKQHFEEAMAHNEKLLAADEESGETPDQDAADAEKEKKDTEVCAQLWGIKLTST